MPNNNEFTSNHFLKKSRINKTKSRMGPILRSAIEYYPALAGLALWVQFADVEGEGAFIAATDGRYIYSGPKYDTYSDANKLFIFLHELLHVALAHPIRGKQLAKRYQDFNHLVYNIACDAIINASLEAVYGAEPIEGAIQLQAVLEKLGEWDRNSSSLETEVRKWSSEALYLKLMENPEALIGKNGILKPGVGKAGNGKGGSNGEGQGEVYASDVLQPGDGDPAPGQEEGNDPGLEIRHWNRQLQLARGSLPGMFNRLVGELPDVKTPWEKLLRNHLYRRLGRRTMTDYSRPNRRWLAIENYMLKEEGIAMPFEPDRSRPKPNGKLAVAFDTSGSVDDEMLRHFAGELAVIMRQTDARVLLVVCDAAVHQVIELEGLKGQQTLKRFEYKGGGGTDFRPAIEEAKKWKPDAMVYFTDLYGPAGDKPREFPMIWAVPEQYADQKAPYGILLKLDKAH